MSRKGFVKLSEEELHKQIAQYEKQEGNLKRNGLLGAIIGLLGFLICMALGSGMVYPRRDQKRQKDWNRRRSGG